MKIQPWRLNTLLLIVLLSLTGLARAQRPPCPKHCACFSDFVSCNNFTEDSLKNLPPRTNTIVLNGGSIKSFPPGFLSQFSRIVLLEIQSCQVDTILNNTFSGFTALDELAISECKIGSIERGAFSNVTNMSKLYLSSSQIGTIHAGAFSRLNEFGDFSMWSNNIETIEPAAFSQMSDLHALSFYMNNVTTLAPDAFDQVRKLGKLEIYLNHFQHLATGPFFPILNTAQEINVYSNTFPCDCGIEDDAFVNETLINRILTSNRCLKDGEIYQLSELPALNICEERVNMTTVSTPKPTTTPFTTKNTATTSVTTTASSQQGDISTKPSSSAPFTKTSLGTSAGTDVTRSGTDVTTTRSASSSTPGKEGKVDNGGSERETADSRSSGNSVASKATIVGLTVVPAVIAVGLFIQ